MKIKTPFFLLEIEYLFLIVFFTFLFSNKVKEILFSFFICYLFIVFHEFSHMFVASLFGKEIAKFKITLSGVCIEFKKVKYSLSEKENSKIKYLKNILIYIAGPISNITLAKLFYYNEMIFQINLFLALINLIPLFPLDGYNILINLSNFFKVNTSVQEIIINFINYFIYFVLIIFGIIQILFYKNISLIIFLIYIYLLQKNNNKNEKKYAKCTVNSY